MRNRFCMLLAAVLSAVSAFAGQYLSEQSRISLLTCAPGSELYARYGHTALRVQDTVNQLDVVFNYGIFDFNTDHFYWKFVRGETYYQLGIESADAFFFGYAYNRRPVYEQVLNLTLPQRQSLFEALVVNYEPQNRYYLYNFVFDNCATRPYQLIKQVLGDSITSTYTGAEGQTYRDFLRRYTRPASWANFGINLLFGRRADRPMHGEQRLFLPEELMFFMAGARLPDGTPLVQSGDIQPFGIQPVPWYATWYLGIALLALALVAVSLWDRHRGKWSWWVEVVMGIVYLALLLIVGFLTFFSIHPLVGFGWRLLIIPAIHLCARLIYIIR